MESRQKFENIYDEFRTLVLSREYYARRMKRQRFLLKWLDIFLAIFAAGSGVLGFALWKSQFVGIPVGPLFLSIATGMAVVVAIVRPYLKLEDDLERLSSMQAVYSALSFAMHDIVRKVKTDGQVDGVADAVYGVLRQVRGNIGTKEDAPPNEKLLRKVMLLVNEMHPENSFYYPGDKVADLDS